MKRVRSKSTVGSYHGGGGFYYSNFAFLGRIWQFKPMATQIRQILKESLQAKQEFLSQADNIQHAAEKIIEAFHAGNKLMICGNGGSAADSQHISAELMGRYQKERKALPAIALSVDSSFVTAWSNDYEYESIFSRQVEALAKKGDIFLGISTSGGSKNVIRAARTAKDKGCFVISLTGREGGDLKIASDLNINVPHDKTARIQECHIAAYHAICELIDEEFA